MTQRSLGLAVLSSLWVLAVLFMPQRAESQACPNFVIEGFGRNTVGGCGGTVYTVTNLNDSGAGSLRDFVSRSGARIIKFGVSGTINLTSSIVIQNPFITIDGSDAPNGGIAIKGGGIKVDNTHDIIIRHIRVRVGNTANTNTDAIQISDGNIYNVVIDHVSVSWADDGSIDITSGGRDVTVQWSILSENIGPGHMLAGRYGSNRITLHHNLYAHGARNPDIYGGPEIDLVNNVMYNYPGYSITWVVPRDNSSRINFVKNYWKKGAE